MINDVRFAAKYTKGNNKNTLTMSVRRRFPPATFPLLAGHEPFAFHEPRATDHVVHWSLGTGFSRVANHESRLTFP
jgi:hypothetical protein